MARFVAEISIPAPVYMPIGERKPLGQIAHYGCKKAYWKIDTEMDSNGTPKPLGICLTMELEATDLETAEDAALDVGLRFSQVLAAYSGSPLQASKLKRVARVGESEGLFEQFNYYYLEGPDALPRVMLRPYQLENLLSWFGSLNERAAYPLELAARWYGMSVGAQDPLDSYLAVWIGLESVGPALDIRVHLNGPRVACEVCKNESGKRRKRAEAGIVHAINAVAPEILQRYSFQQLQQLRHDIAHGLEPADQLRPVAGESLPDLQLSLIFSLLTAARPDVSAPGAGRAILPRDFKVYPDARGSVRSQVEMINYQPYYGGWLPVGREYTEEKSRIESDGQYIWGSGIRTVVETTTDFPELVSEYVIFERMGRSWNSPDADGDSRSISVIPWRTTTVSSAWKHYLGQEN